MNVLHLEGAKTNYPRQYPGADGVHGHDEGLLSLSPRSL